MKTLLTTVLSMRREFRSKSSLTSEYTYRGSDIHTHTFCGSQRNSFKLLIQVKKWQYNFILFILSFSPSYSSYGLPTQCSLFMLIQFEIFPLASKGNLTGGRRTLSFSCPELSRKVAKSPHVATKAEAWNGWQLGHTRYCPSMEWFWIKGIFGLLEFGFITSLVD